MKRLFLVNGKIASVAYVLCLYGISPFLFSFTFACEGKYGDTALGPVCPGNPTSGYKTYVGNMPTEAAQAILLQHVVDAVKSLEKKIAGLDTAVATLQADHTAYKTTTNNDLKAWKETALTDAITKIDNIPAGVAANADFRSAALEALKADLASNQEFLEKLKTAMKP